MAKKFPLVISWNGLSKKQAFKKTEVYTIPFFI